MVDTQVLRNRGQQPRRFVTRRWDHMALERRQSTLHQRMPEVVSTRLCRVLQQEIMAHRRNGHQAEPPVKVSSCVTGLSCGVLRWARRGGSLWVSATMASSPRRLICCCLPKAAPTTRCNPGIANTSQTIRIRGATVVANAGRSHGMPLQRRDACSQLAHPVRAPTRVIHPVITYRKPSGS